MGVGGGRCVGGWGGWGGLWAKDKQNGKQKQNRKTSDFLHHRMQQQQQQQQIQQNSNISGSNNKIFTLYKYKNNHNKIK